MRFVGPIGKVVEHDQTSMRCLTTEELDAAVALQLEQRAEQGFSSVRSTVLSRIAEILSTVPSKEATTAPDACWEEEAELGRVA